MSQQTEGIAFEVLFLDDGSTDGTQAMLEEAEIRNPGRLRYLRLHHSGSPSGPRNCGAREARGQIIVLLDDDVMPDPNLVLCHWRFHQRRPEDWYAALGELYLSPQTRRDPMSLFHTFSYDEVRKKSALSYLYFWTCNVSLKRDFLLENGVFDEDPILHPLEDMECAYRLFSRGLKLEFLLEARGEHLHQMRPSWVPAKGERTGRAQFALTRKVPDIRIRERFGIIAPELSFGSLMWRALRRMAFRITDNPLTHAALRAFGAERGYRNGVTDLYYYLIFRRNILAGYYAAKKEFGRELSQSTLREEFSSAEK
jgi:glycosyltransferase involved in cell wall biosynthesis